MSRGYKVLIYFLAPVFAFLLSACSPATEEEKAEEIRVGAVIPLTGNVAVFGEWINQGLELGQEYWTGQRELEVIVEDSQNSGQEGIKKLRQLIAVNKIDVGLTAMSRVAVPLIPIADQTNLPLLLQDVTYPDITHRSEYVFRHFIQSDREARALALYLANEVRARTVAVLYVNDEAGIGAQEAFSQIFSPYGQVIALEAYETTATDVRTQVLKITSADPDAVFLFGNGPSWARALRQVKESGYNGVVVTNTAMYIPTFKELAGQAVEGVVFTFPYMDQSNESTREFFERYDSRFGGTPPLEAAYAYDLIRLLEKAISLEQGSLVENLSSVEQFDGAFGEVVITKDREVLTPVAVARASASGFEIIKVYSATWTAE